MAYVKFPPQLKLELLEGWKGTSQNMLQNAAQGSSCSNKMIMAHLAQKLLIALGHCS